MSDSFLNQYGVFFICLHLSWNFARSAILSSTCFSCCHQSAGFWLNKVSYMYLNVCYSPSVYFIRIIWTINLTLLHNSLCLFVTCFFCFITFWSCSAGWLVHPLTPDLLIPHKLHRGLQEGLCVCVHVWLRLLERKRLCKTACLRVQYDSRS